MKKLYKSIGQKIRTTRKLKEMTLEDLSNEANIDWSFLARIETGKAIPSLQTLYTLSTVLGLNLSQLFDNTNIDSDLLLERDFANLLNRISLKEKKKLLKIFKLILD